MEGVPSHPVDVLEVCDQQCWKDCSYSVNLTWPETGEYGDIGTGKRRNALKSLTLPGSSALYFCIKFLYMTAYLWNLVFSRVPGNPGQFEPSKIAGKVYDGYPCDWRRCSRWQLDTRKNLDTALCQTLRTKHTRSWARWARRLLQHTGLEQQERQFQVNKRCRPWFWSTTETVPLAGIVAWWSD